MPELAGYISFNVPLLVSDTVLFDISDENFESIIYDEDFWRAMMNDFITQVRIAREIGHGHGHGQG